MALADGSTPYVGQIVVPAPDVKIPAHYWAYSLIEGEITKIRSDGGLVVRFLKATQEHMVGDRYGVEADHVVPCAVGNFKESDFFYILSGSRGDTDDSR